MASGNPGFDSFAWIAGMPEDWFAIQFLQYSAAAVYPIMKKHNLSLWRLEEWYPENRHNMGVTIYGDVSPDVSPDKALYFKIRMRLRNPYRIDEWLNPEIVMDTLLHELVHCLVNDDPEHSPAFWLKLKELENDYFHFHGKLPNSNYFACGTGAVDGRGPSSDQDSDPEQELPEESTTETPV